MCQCSIVPQTDLHSHILPALDDGARTMEESLCMARRAAAAGLRQIVATPHVRDLSEGDDATGGARLRTSADRLRDALRRENVEIEVVSGAEASLSAQLVRRLPEAPWLTIGGRQRSVLVMVEAPFGHWPSCVAELIFRLAVHHVTPIIGHPERLRLVQRAPKALLELVACGARVQLTAGSLARPSARAVRRCAWRLLRLGLVSFVASDAHRAHDLLPGDVVGAVIKAVGEEEAYRVLVENPRLALAGLPVPAPRAGDADLRAEPRAGLARRAEGGRL